MTAFYVFTVDDDLHLHECCIPFIIYLFVFVDLQWKFAYLLLWILHVCVDQSVQLLSACMKDSTCEWIFMKFNIDKFLLNFVNTFLFLVFV